MAKPKAFSKKNLSKKKIPQTLNSADEYLAAGVEFEEAAGKWRAGDSVKSMRFFERAVGVYDEGLQKYPRSLDLAYNKARVQYEVVTHPLLVGQLQLPVLDVLELAVCSHRYALDLDQENADTLFNTSQVLTSMAEELLRIPQPNRDFTTRLLEEALEMQNKCLANQELQYRQDQRARAEAADLPHQALAKSTPPRAAEQEADAHIPFGTSTEDEQWVSVIEPVTVDSLIDTALAQLGTLTVLCESLSAYQPNDSSVKTEAFSSRLLKAKIPEYQKISNERRAEIALAKANLASTVLETRFRGNEIDPTIYRDERDRIFRDPDLQLESSAAALLSNAQSKIALSAALGEMTDFQLNSTSRWNTLDSAITDLSHVSKLRNTDPEDIVKAHRLRGDVSLLQYQLGQPPISYQTALSNAVQLLRNAGVFYRNAAKLSRLTAEQNIAGFRSAVARGLETNSIEACVTAVVGNKPRQWTEAQLIDMVEEGLLAEGP